MLASIALTRSLHAQAAPAAPATTKPETDSTPIVELTPFEVTASKDRGYQATETLAGTRIRTDLKDVGAAISVVTKEFLQDIGATDSATLLQYTTNTEVAGTRGTFLGQGNGTSVEETANLRAPAGAQRVRGLASADNTRDFFVTDIPWDSYNVDRIDINRGANSFLFGLGSPAGIVNASIHDAEFRNMGEAQFRFGSYGGMRSSADINQQLFPKVLALRLDGLWNEKRFEQKQAFENDKRFSAALRADPQLFTRRDFHTTLKAKFEHGDIKADRPRTLPPYDSVTAWFRPIDTKSLDGGMGKYSVLNGYQIGSTGNTFNPWIAGYANQQQPVWFIDGASNQLYRIYGGYVNSGSLGTNGVPQGSAASIVGQRYADTFSRLNSLSGYANNAQLPNYQYGQYRDRTLGDPSVFDFYNNLIDGPTKNEWENWNAYNIDLAQTFWRDRLGIQITYDRQKYKRGGQGLIGDLNSANPTINIDLLQNFQDYVIGPTNAANASVANPNFGRPFVSAGPGNGSSYESDRRYLRGSLFAELRAADLLDANSFLAKVLGRHRFNGVFADEKYFAENRKWQLYGNSAAYATFKTQGAPDTIRNLPPIAVVYLGGTLKNATTSAGANIPGITSNVTLQDGNIYQFDSTWRPQAGVVYTDPWNVPAGALRDTRLGVTSVPISGTALPNPIPIFGGLPGIDPNGVAYTNQLTQVSNPANYVGWNSNFTDKLLRYDNGADASLLSGADKTVRVTKSFAGSWQGYLWNDAIVPTLGWRYDEIKTKGVTAQPQGAAARGALDLSPNVYKLPDTFPDNQTFKDHSTAGGVVVHLNRLLRERDFLPINVSLTYNKSSNFTIANVRRDIYGNPISNPNGSTKDWGVLLSTKDQKFTLRAVKYETNQAAVSTPTDISGITGTIKDALNWRNIKTYYMALYNWGSAQQPAANHFAGVRYMWDPTWVNAAGRPVASGNLPAGDSRIPSTAVHLETQAEADAHRDASLKAINDFQGFLASKGYFTAWNYGVGPTQQSALQTRGQYETSPSPAVSTAAFQNSVYDYRGNPDLQGFAVTSDTASKGYEFELTANPTSNWRLAFNASKTTAVRSNVGGPLLDELVATMDTLIAGPAGDLVRFNSDWSAGNELRSSWTGWRGKYTLLKLQEHTAASELRKWRYNLVTNYSFRQGFLRGAGVGGSYHWQDKVVIGYPVIPDPKNPSLASFDLTKPFYGPSEGSLDLWTSYEHKVTEKINWRIQLNVYNVGKQDKLIPISVEPDGHSWAAARVSPVQEWTLANTFSF